MMRSVSLNVLQKGPGIKLAQNMKLLRESNGLTQKKVAQYLFVDRSTYSYYESGKTQPNLKMLTKLADLYGVSTDALCGATRFLANRLNISGKN
ncbi:helix-turn-helix domain-containing protein [Caproicibacter sp.]|uniref:helix-turn-helix domain-containing protein n=1 Tax=Caproicibacter sp. TaxID=2814884 RepID=UPI003989354F